jgi:HEAT repeat protein
LVALVLAAALSWSPFYQVALSKEPASGPEQLRDANLESRLQAATALAKKQAVAAIPLLIDLLAEVTPSQRQPVERILQELAGEWAPKVTLVGEDDVARRIRRDAWAAWWRNTDGPILLEEFRKRTLSAADTEKIRVHIRNLGDKSFRVREQAMAGLLAYGRVLVPLLRAAPKDADLEARRRAERCLEIIRKSEDRSLPPVAARLLALRKPAGAVEVLLGFLPWTEDDRMRGEVQDALSILAVRNGKVDPALIHALEDPMPVRRAVAAEVIASVGQAKHLPALRKLLADFSRAVRLSVAIALVHAREKEAVPALIDLAADSAPGQRGEAADILERLAGPQAPKIVTANDEASRAKYRAAWQEWWKDHGGTVNLARLNETPLHKARLTARASNSWEANTADKAVDGDPDTVWNAGDYAPQWLEADLGTAAQLGSILLRVGQLPAGPTVHEVWVANEPIGEDRTRAKLAHTFSGNTDNGQELKFDFPKNLFARYVQIRTTQSPSWVAWVHVELRVGRRRFSFRE